MLRRKKKQLKLVTEIAATMAKVHLPGARGSSVKSKVSDGMMSYFEKQQGKKSLDVETRSFAPNS